MLYWKAQRRLNELRKFRNLVKEYFSNTAWDNLGRRRHAVKDLSEVRTKINALIPATVRSCYKVGQSVSVTYKHPAHGIDGHINVIENLFSLDAQRIPVSRAFDYLDRTIGIYEKEVQSLKRARWNPFYWSRLGFLWLPGLPFRVLGAAGFDARSLEQSLFGKLVKAFVGFIVFLAALLQALSLLGLPTGWRQIFSLIPHKP